MKRNAHRERVLKQRKQRRRDREKEKLTRFILSVVIVFLILRPDSFTSSFLLFSLFYHFLSFHLLKNFLTFSLFFSVFITLFHLFYSYFLNSSEAFVLSSFWMTIWWKEGRADRAKAVNATFDFCEECKSFSVKIDEIVENPNVELMKTFKKLPKLNFYLKSMKNHWIFLWNLMKTYEKYNSSIIKKTRQY